MSDEMREVTPEEDRLLNKALMRSVTIVSDTPRTDITLSDCVEAHDAVRLNVMVSLARQLERDLAAANARVDALEKALLAAKIPHHDNDEDCWYSCPKSGHCCNEQLPDDFCNCGADRHNAAIDAAIAASKKGDK